MTKGVKIALAVTGGLLLVTSVFLIAKKMKLRNALIQDDTGKGEEIKRLVAKIDAAANE